MNTVALLQTIPYFSNLNPSELSVFAENTPILHLKCGEELLRQGETGDSAYIVLEGRLRAYRETPDQPATPLGEIGRGEIVGEMAALLGHKRNATILALRHSILLKLENNRLIELLQQQKESLLDLVQTITNRSQKKFAPKSTIASVVLLPISPGLQLDQFVDALRDAVQLHVPSKVLSPTIFESETGKKLEGDAGLTQPALQQYLAGYESDHATILYKAEPEWNNWLACCAGRADKLVLVAEAGQEPEPGLFERQLMEALANLNHVSVELVLLHPTRENAPTNTRQWLENRKLDRHHHLVKGDGADIQRLARFLTNNVIGVALSGGGFRFGLQIGILHAMMEGGIPIDILGGSSGGAVAGALYSQLHDPNGFPKMIDNIYQYSKGVKPITFPLVSLFSGKKFTRLFTRLFQDLEIEDLWTQYFCLSLSLVSGDLIVHKKGPVWRAVRASSSVMGLFPPVIHNKDCLVDGGFINPCPSNIVSQNGADKVIVISASSKSGIQVETHFPPTVSGWSLLFKKLNPFHKQKIVPSIGTNIVQSMYMASDHLLKQVYAESDINLFIEPSVDDFASADSQVLQKLYHFGLEYGRSRIVGWKAELGVK